MATETLAMSERPIGPEGSSENELASCAAGPVAISCTVVVRNADLGHEAQIIQNCRSLTRRRGCVSLAMQMTAAMPTIARIPRRVFSTGTAGRQERADMCPGAGGRSRRFDTQLHMLEMCSSRDSVRLPENGHGSVCAPYFLSPADLRMYVWRSAS